MLRIPDVYLLILVLSVVLASPCAGVLACLDGYMNIAIEQTEEYVNGQLKNKYGDAFLRGNNGELSGLLIILYTLISHCACALKTSFMHSI